MLEAGARAPEFQLQDLSGRTLSIRELTANGPALLAFFKVSCPVCQFTFPFLERIHRGTGLNVIGISQDKASHTREFNQEFGVTFTVLLDEASENYPVSNAFGISSVPTLFLVESDGKISAVFEGFSKRDLEAVARRASVTVFEPGEQVPEVRPG